MGIVSEPESGGKGLVTASYRDLGGDRGWTKGHGRESGLPECRGRQEGTDAAIPPCRAGRRPDGPATRARRTHELSRGAAGLARPEDGPELQAA